MHLDIWIAFVILEPNVVFGPVLLDEVHLQDEGLEFGTDQNPLDIGNLAHEAAGFAVVTSVSVKVGPHAVLQADGLADVDNHAIGVLHQVTARFCRKGSENTLQFFGDFHQINCTRIRWSQ